MVLKLTSEVLTMNNFLIAGLLYIEFPMSLSDIHLISTAFEFMRYVHQHHRIHVLTRFQRYIRIIHSPIDELQSLNNEEE